MKRFAKLMMIAAAACMLLVGATSAMALNKFETDLKVQESVVIVKKMMSSPDAAAARFLLKKAEGVIIVPDMVRAGLVVGAQYGHGILLQRTKDGSFSAPVFLVMGGASAGFQLGAQVTEVMMLVMNDKGIKAVLKGKAKFGVDAAATAGPWGRTASASSAGVKADIYSYSRSQGFYGGATIDGTGMEIDQKSTKAFYGKSYPAKQILAGEVPPTQDAKNLIKTLVKYSNMK